MNDLRGTRTLKELAEEFGMSYSALHQASKWPDFPEPSHVIVGTRLYDRSRVARYLQKPLTGA